MGQLFNDELVDKIIGICTTGRDDRSSDDTHHPYEATSYAVLDRLIEAGYIAMDNTLVDFGCGKGRVPIYMALKCRCYCIGVDMERRFLEIAEENAKKSGTFDMSSMGVLSITSDCSGSKNGHVAFINAMAKDLDITSDMDRFYFFNPFSYNIFKRILSNIKESFYDTPRNINLFFYYPSSEYMGRLMTEDALLFVDEIDCMDLFDGKDPREKIVVFEVT